MPTDDDIADQKKLLAAYRQTLAFWLSQRALSGPIHDRPIVEHAIVDARNNIQRIKSILVSWGIAIKDHPDDEPSNSWKPHEVSEDQFNDKELNEVSSESIGKFELATRDKLKDFFHLKDDGLEIRVYLSRHYSRTIWPLLGANAPVREPARSRLMKYEAEEARFLDEPKQFDPFTVVSALEAIEAIKLKDEIERAPLNDVLSRPGLVSDHVREQLVKKRIHVQLGVCPELADLHYSDMLQPGIKIFIGGPRANLGAYYYLYGEEAGILRPKRAQKNVIESINDTDSQWFCEQHNQHCDECNLALIQWWRIDDNHWVFYLSGTGVTGTAAAVAYLRRYWLEKFYEHRNKRGIAKILRVARAKPENIDQYVSRDWPVYNWYDTKPALVEG